MIALASDHAGYALKKELEEHLRSKGYETKDFGTYSEDVETGWRDLMNLMEMGRLALLRQRTIAKKYRLQLPLTTEATEDQPYPEWVGYVTAEYLMPLPEEETIVVDALGRK